MTDNAAFRERLARNMVDQADVLEALAKHHAGERPTNRCGTCKHWNTADVRRVGPDTWSLEHKDPSGDLARRAAWVNAEQWGDCRRVAFLDAQVGDLAVVSDGSAYRADLTTRADFGCVQHEAKA
jgi:hypothetical protein